MLTKALATFCDEKPLFSAIRLPNSFYRRVCTSAVATLLLADSSQAYFLTFHKPPVQDYYGFRAFSWKQFTLRRTHHTLAASPLISRVSLFFVSCTARDLCSALQQL